MRSCSIIKHLEIVRGTSADYKQLAQFHYRDGKLGPFAAIFAIRPKTQNIGFGIKTAGVVVYTMPSPGCQLRNVAMNNFFAGFDRSTRLKLVNKTIRCINRVIIEPRFRGLGLASWLVRETMGKMETPVVEAMAVMGLVNPFFEKAGMKAYRAKQPKRCVQMEEAFSLVGIEEAQLIDAQKVYSKLSHLPGKEAEFIELQIRWFLQSYGKRRLMTASLERTNFVLDKLTARPVYYIWFNPNLVIGEF